MELTIYLEFAYTPANYFEEPLCIEKEEYRLEIDSGKIKVILKGTGDEKNTEFFDKIQKEIENYFQAIQLVTHKNYSLSKYSLLKEYPDGRKATTVFPDPVIGDFCMCSADIKITSADGTVISDTKRERIDEEKFLAELISKFKNKDKIVQAVLKSYDSAVADPANELIHLYEIRESLCIKFGDKKNVKDILGITDTEWRNFGKLANTSREGRHRGKVLDNLRKATVEELTMARRFAKKLILEYLKLLDRGDVELTI